MSSTRRTFFHQAIAATLAGGVARAAQDPPVGAAPPAPSGATPSPPSKPWLEGGDLIAKMSWLNPPAAVTYDAGKVVAKSRSRTDFWRKTFYGYITDNGHFYHVKLFGEFTFQARVNGNYAALYDQAGLMVRLDEKHWMKCGSELVDGKRYASVVFTHDFSDWSTLDDLSQKEPVYWRVARKKDSIEAQVSEDGRTWFTIRQGYFPPFVEVQVGIMCAAPEGPGFEATFEDLRLDKL
jgi:regulation of enolase protein 1 (concanavalin A-like superfamily)